jgi:hypothetical protein
MAARRAMAMALAAPVILMLAATACGKGTPASAGLSTQDPEEAVLRFAQCMRQHGVDMPDPKVDGDGHFSISFRGSGPRGRNDAAFQRAQTACQHLLPRQGKPPSREQQAQMQDQLVKFAQCMRAHGVDMPDPDFSNGGGGVTFIGGPGKIDPDDPAFQRAQEACKSFLPGEISTGTGGSAGETSGGDAVTGGGR